MIEKVYRDSAGNVINIGEWDYIITHDEDGIEVINNPLPEGATYKDEEVIFLEDDGLGVVTP